MQCQLVFQQEARSCRDDFSKDSYLVDLLRGKALARAEAVSSHTCQETMPYAKLEGSLIIQIN